MFETKGNGTDIKAEATPELKPLKEIAPWETRDRKIEPTTEMTMKKAADIFKSFFNQLVETLDVDKPDSIMKMSAACENSSELQPLDAYQEILGEQENLDSAVKQAYQDKIDGCKDVGGKINDGAELTKAQKGNLGEMIMDLEYMKDGYIRIGDLGITELNQSGHNGIDGVYESTNPPPQFIIADAKYGSSQLNKETNDGPQMSENWIDKRLDAAVGKDKADEIRLAKLMDPDSVKSQLVKISPTGDIQILPIDEDGNIQKGGNINA